MSRQNTTLTEKDRLYESRDVYRVDVHAATISAAVKNVEGKLLECVLGTKAATILEFIQGRRAAMLCSHSLTGIPLGSGVGS